MSVASSRQSPTASTSTSGSDDVHGHNLEDDWEVDGDDGGIIGSDLCKEFPSKFDSYRHLLLEREELDFPSSLNDPLDLLIVGARSDGWLFPIPLGHLAIPSVTTLRNRIVLLEQQLQD